MGTKRKRTLWNLMVVILPGLMFVDPAVASPQVGFTLEIMGDPNAVVPPNLPIMRLTNNSATAILTSFSISVGDTNFHFATIAQTYRELPEIDQGSNLSFVPPNVGTARIDVIDYDFNGFDPQDRFKFQADLDQDAPPQDVALDFQTVLFGNGSVPNAVLTASFSTGEQLVVSVEEYPIPVAGDGSNQFPFVYIFGGGFLDPVSAIEGLIEQVENLNLQQGIANSLDAKLNAALKALDDLNMNNDVAAINSLNAFIDAVEAQSGNLLTAEQAMALVNAAQQIINAIQVGG